MSPFKQKNYMYLKILKHANPKLCFPGIAPDAGDKKAA